jgi:hypothetical protein
MHGKESYGNYKQSRVREILRRIYGKAENIQERLRYLFLRVKEHWGKISNLEELQELIRLEFKQFLLKNPPTEGRLSKRRALAHLNSTLERIINFNPNVEIEVLMNIFEMYSKNYNFDEKIREIVEEAINEYYRQRAEFLSECREFIDSKTGEIINKRGLINRVTKADLNEEELKDVEVYLHGFGVIIFAPEKIIKKFIAKIPRYSLTREPPPAYTNPLEGWIRHIVINKTYIEGKYPRKDRKKILAHELQHAKFGLLEPLFIKFMNREYLSDILVAYKILERYKEEQRSEEISSAKRDLLKRLLEELRESVFDEVKTEIIAQMYGTLYHVKNIEELLYKIWDDLLGERRRLDFLNNARLLNIQIQELDEETRRKLLNDPDFLSFRETILNEEYYRKIVEESLSALGELISVGRYSPTEAVLILYDIPLKKWPAMVRLILKEKEGSKK